MRVDAPGRGGRGGRGGGDGFVLIAVLSVTALLALMLGVSSLLGRGAVDTSLMESAALREEALISAGVELAGHQLFALRLSPEAISGQQVRLNDGTLTIFAVAEAGRVDLNGADETLLASAYRAAGLAGLDPETFATRVLAWRSAAGEGASAPATGSGPPRAAAFRAVGDLRFVDGVGVGDIAALEPFVTVFNPSGRIDPLAAPPGLLAALPGVAADAIETVSALPAVPSTQDILLLRSVFQGLERQMIFGERNRSFSIRIEARLDRGRPPRTVRAVLLVPVTSDRAYHVADWQEG